VPARHSGEARKVAGSDFRTSAFESACGKTAEVAAKASEPAHVAAPEAGEMVTLKPTDGAIPEPADWTSTEPADWTSTEPAQMAAAKPAAGDEITSNPASHMTETPAVASASRRRYVCCRSRQGEPDNKDCDPVQHRALGSLHTSTLRHQIRDPAMSGHGKSPVRGSDDAAAMKEISFDRNKTNDT
jgi:hypothetical protein